MNQSPLVSIIIPVFNCEKYIERIMSSLLSNTYSNYEILFCDDGSLDDSWKMLLSYSHNKNIKIYRNEKNMGPGYTRNRLIKEARGEYIAIQDADDLIDPKRFLEQVSFLEKNPEIDVVGTAANLCNTDGNIWGEVLVEENPKHFHWIFQKTMIHATIMFRRKIGERFLYNEELRTGEDYYFLTNIYLNNYKLRNIPEKLYYYNVTSDGLKSRAADRFREIFKSKLVISKLFPGYFRIVFVSVNLITLCLAFIRGQVVKFIKKITRAD